MKKKKNGTSGGKMLATGVGLALGAGAYYLLGPDGKKNQKKVAGLMGKMKKEVEKELKKTKEVSGPIYEKVVNAVSNEYAKQYEMHGPEIKAFTKKLKSEWKKVTLGHSRAGEAKKPVRKVIKSKKKK